MKKTNKNSKTGRKPYVKREQPKKDSDDKRVNYDNARVSKIEEDMRKDSANDISWYSNNPELMKSAGSIPFASILGSQTEFHVPGVMQIGWSPSFGANDIALNQSMDSALSFIVHANSRNKSYDSPDLGIVIMAGANVFSIIAAMTRAYGTAKAYTEENYYYPDVLLRAQGFNPIDMRRNLSQAWFDLNNLIDQSKQIWIPNVFPILDRWHFLNSKMHTDAAGFRSQTYVYVQNLFLMYNETGSPKGGFLQPVPVPGSSNTTPLKPDEWFNPASNQYSWSQWVQAAQSMIDALINSQDRGIMYGDILKAYGVEKLRALASVPSDYVVAPEYNAEALMQIENTILTPFGINGLVQDPNLNRLVSSYPLFPLYGKKTEGAGGPSAIDYNTYLEKVILNIHTKEQPSPELVTIMTRNIALGAMQSTQNYLDITSSKYAIKSALVLKPETSGSESFHTIRLFERNPENVSNIIITDISQINRQDYTFSGGGSYTDAIAVWHNYGLLSNFDWHPIIYEGCPYITYGTTPSSVVYNPKGSTPFRTFGDLDNYTFIDVTSIKKLNNMALYSELGVPQI